MTKRFLKPKQKGQGLVEYALLLTFVSIVIIVALGLVGLAVTRVYGQVAAALGATRNVATDGGAYSIKITRPPDSLSPPQCGFLAGQGVGFYVPIYLPPNVPLSAVRAYTEGGPESITILPLGDGTANYKVFRIVLGYSGSVAPPHDSSLCPNTVVVQTDKQHGGLTVESPVLIQDWP